MGNNMNCDSCSGNMRNQMDMRRQRNTMNDRYGRNRMMHNPQMNCEDESDRDPLQGMRVGMAYVPWQNFECTYEPAQALQAGTIFPELDMPFYGRRGMR